MKDDTLVTTEASVQELTKQIDRIVEETLTTLNDRYKNCIGKHAMVKYTGAKITFDGVFTGFRVKWVCREPSIYATFNRLNKDGSPSKKPMCCWGYDTEFELTLLEEETTNNKQ